MEPRLDPSRPRNSAVRTRPERQAGPRAGDGFTGGNAAWRCRVLRGDADWPLRQAGQSVAGLAQSRTGLGANSGTTRVVSRHGGKTADVVNPLFRILLENLCPLAR